MDVVSSNLANANTTRAKVNEAGQIEPYRRKLVTMQEDNGSFKSVLRQANYANSNNISGTKVSSIIEDQSAFKLEYNPTHPDSDEAGYVHLPNVDPLKEMVDLMGASRSYEANITSLNATKNMLLKALEIGK